MAGNPTVTISVLSDATDAAAGLTDTAGALDKVGAAAATADGKLAGAAGGLDTYAAAAAAADKPTRDIAGGIDSAGGGAGDMASAFGALAPALAGVGLEGLAGGLETATVALDAAEGATVLFRVATDLSRVAVIKDTAMRVAHATATTVMNTATKLAAAGQWLLNAAMSANPIGIVILLVVALVAAVILLWNKSETFRRIVTAAWQAVLGAVQTAVAWIKGAASSVWAGIQAGVETLKGIISRAWDGIRGAVDKVRSFIAGLNLWSAIEKGIGGLKGVWDRIWSAMMTPVETIKGAVDGVIGAIQGVIDWFGRLSVPDWIGGLFGRGAPAASSASLAGAPALAGTSRAGSGAPATSGPGVHITINGALDPDAVARQVQYLLNRQDRRRVGVTIGRAAGVGA